MREWKGCEIAYKIIRCESAMEGQVRLFWLDRLRQFVELETLGSLGAADGADLSLPSVPEGQFHAFI
jgi:hypothetical protein